MSALQDKVRASAVAIKALAQTHHAREVMLFGSVARGEDGPGSDIDFLVEFEPEASILDLVHLENDLCALLECEVDVLARGGLKPRDQHLLDEAVAL